MSIQDELKAFNTQMGEVIDVHAAMSVLHWDQEVFMPPKGAGARGRQLATLAALSHRLFTAESLGERLNYLNVNKKELTEDQAIQVSESLYDYEQAQKLPEAFVEQFAQEQSKAYEAWIQARKDSDFKQFAPHLEILVDLLRQKAEYMGYDGSPYDALLSEYERGISTAELKTIFSELAPRQRDLVAKIVASEHQPDLAWVDKNWDEQVQWDLGVDVLRDMGYDFDAGRQDKSVHPFTTNFDQADVRVTTRIHPRELFSGLTGSIHEGGHALYEQGFLECDRRTVLAEAISLGIHESQSRMWENIIGRSQPFWNHYTPRFQAAYGKQLDGITPEQMYAAINHVQPSFIRVEADECTYNLHVILRFELEVDLIEGRLDVKDVPEAWNAKVKDYLGLDVPDDAHGCLQDIHWSHGSMGYFPTYTLGNLYASQLFEQIEKDLPDIWSEVGAGQFAPLLEWLRARVHNVGRRKQATVLIEDITGKAPDSEAFMRYLNTKYGALYQL